MEESEKRRERLRAMRMDAAEAEVSDIQIATAGPGYPLNPLHNPFATPSAPENVHAVSRFDFYTDPMSAFSGSKKRNNDGSQNRQDYLSTPIGSCSPMGWNGSQNRQDYFSTPIGSGSPMGWMSSSHLAGSRNNDMSPAPHHFQMNYSPDQRLYETPLQVPMSCSWRSPTGVPSPFSGHRGTPAGVPGAWNHSGCSPGYRRGGFHIPDYGCGSSARTNSGRGNYQRYNSSSSPGSGRSGGRGRGFHAYVSAQEQPALFYSKTMLEDPWRFLKPVVGSLVAISKDNLKTPDSLKPWLQKSLSMKKTKASEHAAEFSSQSSFADRLSLAFQEAVEDAANA